MRELLTASITLEGDQKEGKSYDKNIEKPIKKEEEVKQKISTGMQTDHPF